MGVLTKDTVSLKVYSSLLVWLYPAKDIKFSTSVGPVIAVSLQGISYVKFAVLPADQDDYGYIWALTVIW